MATTFNTGRSVTSTIADTGAVFGAAASAVNTASKLGSALSSSTDVLSAIRSINLPAAGEAIGDITSAIAMFNNTDDPNDWRVRLSIPNWVSFLNSPVLAPLRSAHGLIFPYTPTIDIRSTAHYETQSVVHSNSPFYAYQRSEPGLITITAPMNVEDKDQALYWIAAVHYLRSISKMFSGIDPKAGNPPPIVFLNGYGNYVFKNVPVIIQSFTTSLGNDCDYIGVEVYGSQASVIGNEIDTAGGLLGSVGNILGVTDITNTITGITGAAGQISNLLGSYNIGGTVSGGISYVPTKSQFTITLQTAYSRTSMRNFSLDRFVSGGYLNNYFGYV